MKRILTTFLAVFSFVACFAQSKSKILSQPEVTKAKKYETLQLMKRQKLVDLHTVKAMASPMDEDEARRYVKNYQHSKLATTIEAIHFDTPTIENFSTLFKNQQIDGIRAYMARYDDGKFTIILVGTKTIGGKHVDQVIPLTIGSRIASSIQNFGDPCPPPGCEGNTIAQ